MYNGLTTADKGALLDAKARGAEWVARDKDDELAAFRLKPQKYVDMELNSDHWERTQFGNYFIVMPSDEPLQFIQWSDPEPVNIDLALAQIAEMESKEKPDGCEYCATNGTIWSRFTSVCYRQDGEKRFDVFSFPLLRPLVLRDCGGDVERFNVIWRNKRQRSFCYSDDNRRISKKPSIISSLWNL